MGNNQLTNIKSIKHMKRSDFVKQVTLECGRRPSLSLVSEILEIAERLGMLPPARYRDHDWHEKGITYCQWIQQSQKINEWNKEEQTDEHGGIK